LWPVRYAKEMTRNNKKIEWKLLGKVENIVVDNVVFVIPDDWNEVIASVKGAISPGNYPFSE
jgi:hypothetical protein